MSKRKPEMQLTQDNYESVEASIGQSNSATFQTASASVLAARKKFRARRREPDVKTASAPAASKLSWSFSTPETTSSFELKPPSFTFTPTLPPFTGFSSTSSSSPAKSSDSQGTAALSFNTPGTAIAPETKTPSSSFKFEFTNAQPKADSTLFGTNVPKSAPGSGSEVVMPAPTTTPLPTNVTQIPKDQLKTGEEDETKVFGGRAKLYAFEAKEKKWLERGVGHLTLNVAPSESSRLVMRSDGSFRVILNLRITTDLKVVKANDKSIRITSFTPEGIVTNCVKFNKADEVTDLLKHIDERKAKAPEPTEVKKDDKKEEQEEPAKPKDTQETAAASATAGKESTDGGAEATKKEESAEGVAADKESTDGGAEATKNDESADGVADKEEGSTTTEDSKESTSNAGTVEQSTTAAEDPQPATEATTKEVKP